MYLSKLSLINYRNFSNARFLFNKGVNTIIGENGAGKTNVFRAIRLLLDPNMRRSAWRLNENDFHRGLDCWKGHWIIISLEFDELTDDDSIQSLFIHSAGSALTDSVTTATYNLIFRPNASIREKLSQLKKNDTNALKSLLDSITIFDYEPLITGRSTANFNDPMIYKIIVGDFESVDFPKEINGSLIGSPVGSYFNLQDDISFTFIKALRDVVSDFNSNMKNPLLKLLKAKSGEINKEEFLDISEKVNVLNSSIEELPDVKTVRDDIHRTINGAAGDTYAPDKLSIKSGLSEQAEEIFQSLILHVGESNDGYEGPINELSLGGANLIYLTLKLLEFKYQQKQESFANFLLIEEPEAHIHTHIQKTLFDKVNYSDTQIIYTTHSTHISDVSNVQHMNIIGKKGNGYEAYQPSNGLESIQVRAIQRYLDAIRSNLLFAKSVVLVEGDAEEILIPILIKKVLGISLDELGISLINVRSTGFENVAQLFHDDRIRKRCSIITDLDSAFFDTTIYEGDNKTTENAKKKAKGSQKSGIERRDKLNTFIANNQWIDSFFAPHTFEVDFVSYGNEEAAVKLVKDVYTDKKTKELAIQELRSKDIALYGKRILTMANNQGKGWFAIQLGDVIDYNTIIPDYISEALSFAHPKLNDSIKSKIIKHRLRSKFKSKEIKKSQQQAFVKLFKKLSANEISFDDIFELFKKTFPNDSMINVIENF